MDLNAVWTFKNLKIRNEKYHKEKVTLFKQNWTNVNVCRRSFLCKFLWATKHAQISTEEETESGRNDEDFNERITANHDIETIL